MVRDTVPKRIPSKIRAICAQLGEDPRDPSVYRDVMCGLHSRIPVCCIAFWIKVAMPLQRIPDPADAKKMGPEAFAALIHYNDWDRARGPIGYVRCPSCVLDGTVVAIRRCGCFGRRRFVTLADGSVAQAI